MSNNTRRKDSYICWIPCLFSDNATKSIDSFCSKYDAVVFCDHTSNYHGKFRVVTGLIGQQENSIGKVFPDLLIHIGQVSGDYASMGLAGRAKRFGEYLLMENYMIPLKIR